MKFCLLTVSFLAFLHVALFSQKINAEDRWVDDIYKTMNDTQRIGQLIMIRAHSNLGSDHIGQVEYLIKKYHVGSLCFFQGTPERQLELTNRYQKLSEIPLFVAMDAEWGVNMRLKSSSIAYPKQIMLGAITDNQLVYRFGEAIARECRRLGVHINFAPSIDINNNRNNPIINERSFGDNMYNVAAKGFAYAKGMQDNSVMACAKHFPGHGDTDKDSHVDLPVVNHDFAHLSALEMMPFRALSQHGVQSMMVAHLSIPSIDNTWHLPTSLSKNAVRDLLRNQIGFNGLIFTDGLEMRGVTRYFQNGEASAKAIEAGCDILCLPESTPEAFNAIKRYISEGRIDTNSLEASVKRVLHAKYRYGLTTPQYIDPSNVRGEINSIESKDLKSELIKNALTLVRNDDKIVPFRSFEPDSMAVLAIGSESWTTFQLQLNNAGLRSQFNVSKYFSAEKRAQMLDYFSKKKIVIVSLHGLRVKASENFGVSSVTPSFVNELAQRTKVVLVVFGNPYILKDFDGTNNVLECYNEEKETQEFAAQGLLGVFDFKGKLPITASEKSKNGFDFSIKTTLSPEIGSSKSLSNTSVPTSNTGMPTASTNTTTPQYNGATASTTTTPQNNNKPTVSTNTTTTPQYNASTSTVKPVSNTLIVAPARVVEKPNVALNSFSKKISRLESQPTTSETAKMDAKTLNAIDTIAKELIKAHAAPGCQILVARNGQVVYNKSFGYHTYEKLQATTNDDLFDLASITKCAATTVCLMKLHEEGKVDLNKTLGDYLPYLRDMKSNKANLTLKDVLIHQAGLPAWIPFYKATLDSAMVDGKKRFFPSSTWYAKTQGGSYGVPVASNMFMRSDYMEVMKTRIAEVPLRHSRSYLYSDLGLILLADIIQRITGKTLDVYADASFYTPLSMNRTLFNPLSRFSASSCAPTEEDNYFRMARVQGTVHDMAAAMLGGVTGHAGLFSTSSDLAILLQMLLNEGEYNGVRYFKPETVQLFTSRQGGSTRRGYGWDMKELSPSKTLNMSNLASYATYGHTGFTGNAAYVDPEKNLIYIFLSNRTYPDSGNNKLINGHYRTRIQNVVYEAMR